MKSEKYPDKFCAFPFVQLSTHPTGRIVPCCWNDHELGNIQQQSIGEIWNSEKIQNLRKEFLTGDVKVCADHIRNRQCHQWSWHLMRHVKPSPQQDLKDIKSLYAQLNGRCNLECIMCDVWKMPNGLYTEEKFWKAAGSGIFPNLREIYISGGEPFLLKDTYRLIDEITAVNKNCLFKFSTNAHWRFSDKIKLYLDKANIRLVFISIDSLDENVFPKIRLKGDLNQVHETVDDICAYREERIHGGRSYFEIGIETAIQKDNCTEIEAFVRYARQRNIKNTFSFVYYPHSLSLLSLPTGMKYESLALFLNALQDTAEKTILNLIIPLFDSLAETEKLAFFRSQIRNLRRDGEKIKEPLISIPVSLSGWDFEFTLTCSDHRICNHRLLQEIFTGKQQMRSGFFRNAHHFWESYCREILPHLCAVNLLSESNSSESSSGNGVIPGDLRLNNIDLQSVFTKYDKPVPDAPWIPAVELFLIYMIRGGFSMQKTKQKLQPVLKNYLFPESISDGDDGIMLLIKKIKYWAESNPDEGLKVENALRKERDDWKREQFVNNVLVAQQHSQPSQLFGKPGEIFNTGWISLIALAYIECEGKFFAGDGRFQQVEQVINRLAPNFPHLLRHYFFDGFGNDFIHDCIKWAQENPEEVRDIEESYRSAYEAESIT